MSEEDASMLSSGRPFSMMVHHLDELQKRVHPVLASVSTEVGQLGETFGDALGGIGNASTDIGGMPMPINNKTLILFSVAALCVLCLAVCLCQSFRFIWYKRRRARALHLWNETLANLGGEFDHNAIQHAPLEFTFTNENGDIVVRGSSNAMAKRKPNLIGNPSRDRRSAHLVEQDPLLDTPPKSKIELYDDTTKYTGATIRSCDDHPSMLEEAMACSRSLEQARQALRVKSSGSREVLDLDAVNLD
mmetsp:Transcript_27620/g.66939  ORF Transcript_27620/g.66939 Transcript_27620/m.66939 type:complete len:247 (+) Transcript_27620:154-894(+)